MQPQKYGQRILVGEDELEVRDYLEMALKCLGYTVELAQDGEEVMSQLKSGQSDFSAVLLDLVMPRRSGLTVLDRMHRTGMRSTPIIMMTGTDELRHREAARLRGVSVFLCKPFPMEQLLLEVETILNA